MGRLVPAAAAGQHSNRTRLRVAQPGLHDHVFVGEEGEARVEIGEPLQHFPHRPGAGLLISFFMGFPPTDLQGECTIHLTPHNRTAIGDRASPLAPHLEDACRAIIRALYQIQ